MNDPVYLDFNIMFPGFKQNDRGLSAVMVGSNERDLFMKDYDLGILCISVCEKLNQLGERAERNWTSDEVESRTGEIKIHQIWSDGGSCGNTVMKFVEYKKRFAEIVMIFSAKQQWVNFTDDAKRQAVEKWICDGCIVEDYGNSATMYFAF
jgi:hypothetical protein